MRVLITGGVGNIGQEILRILLDSGHTPVLFDLIEANANLPVVCYVGSILDHAALMAALREHRIDVVIHLASMLQFGCERDPAKAVEVNVNGTLNVLEAARTAVVSRVILAGSLATYGSTDEVIVEDSPIQSDVSLYGVTKLLNEKLLRRYNALYGMDCLALRYAAVLSERPVASPGVAAALATIFDAASGNDVVVEGVAAEEKRHYCYTKDIASGTVAAALATSTKSDLFNIAGGQDSYVSFQEIAALVRKHAPSCGRISFHGRSGDRGRMDISRANAELGYAPQYTLDSAVADIVRSRLAA